MNLEDLKKRRFRVAASILIALAAVFFMTGQLRMVNFSKGKVLKVGVFSDSYWGVQSGYANKIIDDAIERFESEHPDVNVQYESGIMKTDYSEWLSEQSTSSGILSQGDSESISPNANLTVNNLVSLSSIVDSSSRPSFTALTARGVSDPHSRSMPALMAAAIASTGLADQP